MATLLRRHWLKLSVQGTLGVALVVLVGTIYLAGLDGEGQVFGQTQSAEAEELDAQTYLQLQQLRRQLGLQAADLAAIGCDREAAETVLVQLQQWHEQHGDRLREARRSVQAAERELRQTMQAVHVGPRDEQRIRQVPQLQGQRARERQRHDQLLEEAGEAITTPLAFEQREAWQVRWRNREAPARYRSAPYLSDQQVQALREPAGRAVRDRGASRSAFSGDASVLNSVQRRALEQAQANRQAHLLDVQMAEEAVLPKPAELKLSDQQMDGPLPVRSRPER